MAEHRDQPRESLDREGKPRRRSRRVTTEVPAGSDPSPAPEPPRHASTENDDRLKRDKPPHWQ
jgi:hypothetical protein